MTTPRGLPVSERLSNVIPVTECGCHIWMGGVGSDGYGRLKIKGKMVGVHRLSWELSNGPIPQGLHVLHKCDVRPCMNPDHLYVGTPKENSDDKIRRGRARHKTPFGSQNHLAKISEDVALLIKTSNEPQAFMAKKFGISQSNISKIRSGVTWKHLEVIPL